METHTNYKAEFSFFFLQGNIAFLCNFKIKIDQTDINPNFGVSNTNKVTAWHRINNYCQLLNYVQDPLVFKCTLSAPKPVFQAL